MNTPKDVEDDFTADPETCRIMKPGTVRIPKKDGPVIPTTVKVTIGEYTITYLLHKTTAPRAYDGFGTMTVYAGDKERYIVIDQKHLEWQKGRNGSGLHVTEPCNMLSKGDLENRFWEIIKKGFDGEDDE